MRTFLLQSAFCFGLTALTSTLAVEPYRYGVELRDQTRQQPVSGAQAAHLGNAANLIKGPRLNVTEMARGTAAVAPMPASLQKPKQTPTRTRSSAQTSRARERMEVASLVQPKLVPRRIVAPPSPSLSPPAPPVTDGLFIQTTTFTPYDRYMGQVRQVLGRLDGAERSMDRVRDLMRRGKSFRYVFRDPYTAAPPEVTGTKETGDCKSKSLWLASQLDDSSVRYVIGKARANSRIRHAWLYWRHNSRWWILDCTNKFEPILADSVPRDEYVPYYSFAKEATYRHKATQLIYANLSGARKSLPVASNSRQR